MSSDSKSDPVIGSLIDGRYLVATLLGQGGMGSVYLAEETRLRRRCALKVLHPALARDRTHVARFLREAQTIAQLEHPNIVDIYAYGEEPSGVVWFAMELLVGEDLDLRLRARMVRPFTTWQCCAWGVQIAQAVAAVHDAGLIHRDLKTSNIFLTRRRDGEEAVKLLDFGIARPEEGSELTTTGVALGTPSYMSPEQVSNAPVDRRSDIYSFGVLLFKLLTNRLPFSGEPIQVAMAHCTTPAPVPSAVATETDISPELDALVLRALAKDPDERYQSMREIERALAAILQTEAPELAGVAKPRTGRTMGHAGAEKLVLPPTRASPAVSGDPATDAAAVQAADPTRALPPRHRSRTGRWLYISGAACFLALGLCTINTMATRDGDSAVAVAPRLELPPPPAVASPVTAAGPVATAPGPVTVPAGPVAEAPEHPEPAPQSVPAPPLKPKAAPKSPAPRAKKPGVAVPIDPMKQIQGKAKTCRRKYGAVGGPDITIDYAVGMDGKVVRSIPSTNDDLGKCLAAAVQAAQFEPKVVLGRKITL